MGLDEVFFGKFALLDGQPASFFPVVDNASQRVILVLQVGLIERPRGRIGVVDLGPIDLLEGLHRADGADQLKIGVVTEQVPDVVKSEGRHAVRGMKYRTCIPIFAKYWSVDENSSCLYSTPMTGC